jgi:hypothetical protein
MMKRLIISLIVMVACVSVADAKTPLTGTWNSWGDGCTVDGNSINFTGEWKGASCWLGDIDASGNDYLVVVFSEAVKGSINLIAQFNSGDNTVSSDAVTISQGCSIAKIDLSASNLTEWLNDLDQIILLSTSDTASCTVKSVYLGSKAEYEADATGAIIDANVTPKSGWDGCTVSMEEGVTVVTFTNAWTAAANWLNGFDASDYKYLVCELAEATTMGTQLVIQYASADADGQTNVSQYAEAGSGSIVIALDDSRKNNILQIFLQNAEPGTVKISKICFTNNITDGIQSIQHAYRESTDAVYSLSGKRCNSAKLSRGIYIKNGKKVLAK